MIAFDKPLFDSHDKLVYLLVDRKKPQAGGWKVAAPRALAIDALSTENRVKKSLQKLVQAEMLEAKTLFDGQTIGSIQFKTKAKL